MAFIICTAAVPQRLHFPSVGVLDKRSFQELPHRVQLECHYGIIRTPKTLYGMVLGDRIPYWQTSGTIGILERELYRVPLKGFEVI